MNFFKKQHEDIAVGFLKRIDYLLRSQTKAVSGYSIDNGIETLKLRIGKSIVTMTIEGEMISHREEQLSPEHDPLIQHESLEEDAKEVLY